MTKQEEIRQLLTDWVNARLYVISETSGDFTADYRELVERAMARAILLDIEWNDDLIPSYVWDTLNDADEPPALYWPAGGGPTP